MMVQWANSYTNEIAECDIGMGSEWGWITKGNEEL